MESTHPKEMNIQFSVILTFMVLIFGYSCLWGLDRITLENGTILNVKILDQNQEFVIYVSGENITNKLQKYEVLNIELQVTDDRFYAAALEETNLSQKIYYLKKSIIKFPEQSYNQLFLTRLYLAEMMLDEAAEIITNKYLTDPTYEPFFILYLLKSENAKLALSTLDQWGSNKMPNQGPIFAVLRTLGEIEQSKSSDYLRIFAPMKEYSSNQISKASELLMLYEPYAIYQSNMIQLSKLENALFLLKEGKRFEIEDLIQKKTKVYLRPKVAHTASEEKLNLEKELITLREQLRELELQIGERTARLSALENKASNAKDFAFNQRMINLKNTITTYSDSQTRNLMLATASTTLLAGGLITGLLLNQKGRETYSIYKAQNNQDTATKLGDDYLASLNLADSFFLIAESGLILSAVFIPWFILDTLIIHEKSKLVQSLRGDRIGLRIMSNPTFSKLEVTYAF